MTFRSSEYAAGWLAGMIDGEGSVYDGGRSRYVKVSNTDPALIRAVCDALDLLGIEYRVEVCRRKRLEWRQLYNVVIGRRAHIVKLRECLQLKSPAKIERLSAIPAGYGHKGGKLGRRNKYTVIDIDELRELRERGLTVPQIADHLGIKPGAAQMRLRRAGLTRRRPAA